MRRPLRFPLARFIGCFIGTKRFAALIESHTTGVSIGCAHASRFAAAAPFVPEIVFLSPSTNAEMNYR
jgi:hypothetical protein